MGQRNSEPTISDSIEEFFEPMLSDAIEDNLFDGEPVVPGKSRLAELRRRAELSFREPLNKSMVPLHGLKHAAASDAAPRRNPKAKAGCPWRGLQRRIPESGADADVHLSTLSRLQRQLLARPGPGQ